MPDIFDTLLNSLCDILQKQQFDQGSDAYGQPAQDYRTKITAWPCRVSTMHGGQEYKIGKELAKNMFKVFMRPPTQDDSGVPFTLTTHHWLKVGSNYLNVIAVNDPSLLGHHLEVMCEQVIP